MTVPCRIRPNDYLQPGEDPDWGTTPAARWAMAQCRNTCERFTECAADALAIGTCEGQKRDRIADGCIMAGIVCKGDAATYRLLHEIVNPGTEPEPYIAEAGDACTECDRTFIDADITPVLGENTAHRATPTRSLCRGCYSRQQRAGTLSPVVEFILPTHCLGPCGRLLRRRAQAVDPNVPSARHESGGYCGACIRAAARTEKAAA